MPDDQGSRLRLADAISELRREIRRAQNDGEGSEIRFRAKEIELELSIDFDFGVEAETGLPKWLPFIEAKVKGNIDRKSAHKVVLHLEIDDSVPHADGKKAANVIGDDEGPAPAPAPAPN